MIRSHWMLRLLNPFSFFPSFVLLLYMIVPLDMVSLPELFDWYGVCFLLV